MNELRVVSTALGASTGCVFEEGGCWKVSRVEESEGEIVIAVVIIVSK